MGPDPARWREDRYGRAGLRTSRSSAIVREAESGGRAMEVCRRHRVSKETLRRWRAKYRGLELQEARRLKQLEEEQFEEEQLEEENRRLKYLVTEQVLDLSLHKDVVGRRW